MKIKEMQVKYRDDGNGQIEGYASTFIRKPDSYGDVVKRGAFAKTLAERWNGGKGIPFLWAHKMDDLKAFIGTAEAEEDEKGLRFVATFDDTEEAQKVRQLYKDGRLRKFSFAYDIKEEGLVTLEDGMKANELRELDLFEISLALMGTIVSFTSRLFSFKVAPVSTMSTITSERESIGAISIEPLSFIISISRLFEA